VCVVGVDDSSLSVCVCVVCELQNPSMSVFLNGLESSGVCGGCR